MRDHRDQLRRLQQHMEDSEREANAPPAGTADPIERLLEEIRHDPELGHVRLTANFVNDIGYVLERDGFGAAQAYLLDRTTRQELAPQARFVLNNVLPKLKGCPPIVSRRALGRYVIKVLPTLQQRSESHD